MHVEEDSLSTSLSNWYSIPDVVNSFLNLHIVATHVEAGLIESDYVIEYVASWSTE